MWEGEPKIGADVVGLSLAPVQMWEGEPKIGADVVGLSLAPVQMWEGGCITLVP